MLKNATGSEDGIHISMFEKDQEYDITEALFKPFVEHMKVAVEIEEESEAVDDAYSKMMDKPKMEKPSYENKMVEPSSENKVEEVEEVEEEKKPRKRGGKFRRS